MKSILANPSLHITVRLCVFRLEIQVILWKIFPLPHFYVAWIHMYMEVQKYIH